MEHESGESPSKVALGCKGSNVGPGDTRAGLEEAAIDATPNI